ncbi:MAG: DUF4349 domain-containing protein [Actinomycetota bacterium]|nr:DUF4349 domain-containing protein [Actinomycetota bacterium]
MARTYGTAQGDAITTRRRIAALCLLGVLALAACSGADSESTSSAGSDGEAAQEMEAAPRGNEGRAIAETGSGAGSSAALAQTTSSGVGGSGGDTSGATGVATKLPSVGPSVIKTATVTVAVPDDELDETLNEAVSTAGRYGGFVLSSRLGRRDSGGTLTMRIPANRFEAALADLEALGEVRAENISGEDVGQEFVDLQARLRNWESQEAVLLKLMGRAESVVDTIRVQSELSRVQLEIEQLRGRLNFLRDQTSLGTITATFSPLTPPRPDAPSRFAQAWSRALDLMQSFVAGMIVTMGVIVPLALIALVGYLIFRGLRPRLTS